MNSSRDSNSRLWSFQRNPIYSPVDIDNPIKGAIEDAEVLLAFAAQSRRSLKKELIEKLTTAIETVRDASVDGKAISAAERSEFWIAYDELVVAMAPLSAHSIRTSIAINERRFPLSLISPTAIMAAVTIAVFILCIAFQSFWVAGKALLDESDAVEKLRLDLSRQQALSHDARKL